MELNNIYSTHYKNKPRIVYEGLCDSIPTKWITTTKWDFKISIQHVNGELLYTDSKGNEIIVFDIDDKEYEII